MGRQDVLERMKEAYGSIDAIPPEQVTKDEGRLDNLLRDLMLLYLRFFPEFLKLNHLRGKSPLI